MLSPGDSEIWNNPVVLDIHVATTQQDIFKASESAFVNSALYECLTATPQLGTWVILVLVWNTHPTDTGAG